MNVITYNSRNGKLKQKLINRTPKNAAKEIETVQQILSDIKKNGLSAVLKYANKFDGFNNNNIKVSRKELIESEKKSNKKIQTGS